MAFLFTYKAESSSKLLHTYFFFIMANIAVQRIKRELKEVLNSDEVIEMFAI